MFTVRSMFLSAVAVGLVLTGCSPGQSGEVNNGNAPQGTNRPSETPSEEAPVSEGPVVEVPSEEPTTEEPAAPTNPVFGETYTWENGVSVTIGVPTPFEPSDYAVVEGAAAYVAFDVTIVNGSPENYDPIAFNATAQSGNQEAQQVFDLENGLEGSPSTTVLPGREVSFKIGYGLADPADIVMDVSAGFFEYDNAIFTS